MGSLWLLPVFFAIGALTFLQRFSFIALFGRRSMPLWLAGALRFVPPAVLCAIIFPEILMSNGTLAINAANHRLIAAVLATVVAVASRSLFLTIAVGMAALWAVAWLAG